MNKLITHVFLSIFLICRSLLFAGEKEIQYSGETLDQANHSNVHTFFDVTFKNDYMTPRGLLVSNTGLTIQTLNGIVLDIYKNSDNFLNEVSLKFGVWNDFWTDQDSPAAGP